MTIANNKHYFSFVNTNIGKKAVFFNSFDGPEVIYRFTSTLDKIGVEWDRQLQNNTHVIILSDPVELNRESYGLISITKISAKGEEMWVRTEHLVDIK